MRKIERLKGKKGFTLIELLAVIIILGVLLLIAVPSISKYIENSRKNTYINSVKSMASAVSTSINSLDKEIPFYVSKNEGIIVPFSEIELEKKGATIKSPYSKWVPEKSYILVMYDGDNYEYYISALDETGYGIPLVNNKDLSVKSITTDTNVLSSNCIPYSSFATLRTVDTDELTMQYNKQNGNYIKVKVGHSAYDAGDVIQLKDGSKWYSTVKNPLENNTITLVSYYTMATSPIKYGQQDSSNPTIPFHASTQNQNPAIYDSNASIYAIAEEIKSKTKALLVKNGINMNGATVDMPILSDFGCDRTSPSDCRIANYFKESKSFWTKETNGGWVFIISNTLEVGEATTKNVDTIGIRIVIRNLDKSNIDKKATRTLNN